MPDAPRTMFWATHAWVGGGWCDGALLQADAAGCWNDVRTGVSVPPAGATVLPGPVLPGLVNAHSHAFQRAFAGMAERRQSAQDSFWSWRERMYQVALRITPAQLQAIAAQLFAEALCGGYTQMCEFHYLQHQPDGVPYADPLQLCWALTNAAAEAGIGLTVLPVLYERAGFAAPQLLAEQRRFALSANEVIAAQCAVTQAGLPLVNAGLAIHSLRAAAPDSIHQLQRLADFAEGFAGPIHIHVAEQQSEVQACLSATGVRPLAWLAREGLLDSRWQLVHATHSEPQEIAAVAATGAGVVICPSTEANLGDGLADLPGWLAAGVPLSIGSDSQVSRAWPEELRWLEYGQRLQQQSRNLSANPASGEESSAARLFNQAIAGGKRSAGLQAWGLAKGARADALVLDLNAAGMQGIPPSHWLDAAVFATNAPPFREVYVAGKKLVERGRHMHEAVIGEHFSAVMRELWG